MGELRGRFINALAHPSENQLEWPGDYRVLWEDGEPAGLAFILPTGRRGRIPALGHGKDGEPEWVISITADGLVTVSPSINAEGHWHGLLTNGMWSDAWAGWSAGGDHG